jgi:hypothetical protein
MSSNENMITELVESTGCDFTLAGMLLKFTGWDLEGARRIIEAVPKDIFAVKIKFITQITGFFGALFLSYDEKKKEIKRFIGVITDDKDLGSLSIEKHWRDFEDELYTYARNRKIDGLKVDQIKKRMTGEEFISKLSNVLMVGRPVKNDMLTNTLVDELYNTFTDTNIAVKFSIEMTDAFELNRGTKQSQIGDITGRDLDPDEVDVEVERRDTATRHQRDKSLVVLSVDPVLSPVSGVSIQDLEFGDEIQVRITDEREIADYLAELLGAKVDSIRVPIFTRIIEVKELETGDLGVFTQFGPGILGMFKVPEDVKVATRSSAEEESVPVERKTRQELNPLIVVGGIVAVLIIFIILVLITR